MAKASKLDSSYHIHVIKFDKHNTKSTGKILPWFKLDRGMARSSKFLKLNSGSKHLWLWLLCEAAGSRQRMAICHGGDMEREVHIARDRLEVHLRELVSLEWIRIVKSPEIRVDKSREEKKRIEETSKPVGLPDLVLENESPKPPSKIDEIEKIYLAYPRKIGKADGMRVLQKTILTEIQVEELRKAVANYAESCRISGSEEKYIKHWSSFVGTLEIPRWRDWIDWTPPEKSGRKHVTRSTQTYDNLELLEQEWAAKGSEGE
jgi:hypothetical protein